VTRATVSADGETIVVHIPMTFRRRGGRKLVVTPDGAECAPRPRVDNAMVKALARAFRWRRMLDDGVYATIEELAKARRLRKSYVSQVLRLTLLAPDLIEAIVDGRGRPELQLDDLLDAFPLEWSRQFDTMAKPVSRIRNSVWTVPPRRRAERRHSTPYRERPLRAAIGVSGYSARRWRRPS
jgi:hypothetical protein